MMTLPFCIQRYSWIVPAGIMYGVAPSFIVIWGGWRLMTAVLPRSVYQRGDDFLYSLYQRMVLFFFENCSGCKVVLSGDIEEVTKKSERVIMMSNHQCSVDWMVADMLAERQGSIGYIRYVLKNSLRWLPLYGFYFAQRNCIFVKRGNQSQLKNAEKSLAQFVAKDNPFWMVVFPEGTRFHPEKKSVISRSRQFASDQGLKPLDHLLTPRYKALKIALDEMRSKTQAIYDVTIGYSNTVDEKHGTRIQAPSLTGFLAGFSSQLHIHVVRIPISEVPTEETELKAWLYHRFQIKDSLLERFYSRQSDVRGTLCESGQVHPLPLTNTFPAFLFWVACNAVLLGFPVARAMFWKASVFAALAGWVWVAIF